MTGRRRTLVVRAMMIGQDTFATRARAGLARIRGAPLRRAASRVLDPLVARRAARGEGPFFEGPLSINPSGTVLAGRRIVAAAMDAMATDWLVAAFPSPLRFDGAVLPHGYGPNSDAVTLLSEALPASLWLDGRDAAAVMLLGLPLAQLNATQEALNAQLFGARRVRPHAAHRVASACGVWLPPRQALVATRAAAGARLAAVFEPVRSDVVALLPHGHPATAELQMAWGEKAVIDPARRPLWEWGPRLSGARAVVTCEGRDERLAALYPQTPHHVLAPGRGGAQTARGWRDALG